MSIHSSFRFLRARGEVIDSKISFSCFHVDIFWLIFEKGLFLYVIYEWCNKFHVLFWLWKCSLGLMWTFWVIPEAKSLDSCDELFFGCKFTSNSSLKCVNDLNPKHVSFTLCNMWNFTHLIYPCVKNNLPRFNPSYAKIPTSRHLIVIWKFS
jgi:hypothetical protein